MELLVATNNGLITVRQEASGYQVSNRALEGEFITTVIAREGTILAGTTHGIFASPDGGQNWVEANDGLAFDHVRWLAYHPQVPDLEFAGTEPAGIFISREGGANWQECMEVSELRQHFGWWLPYSAEAGCVRGFAFHGERAYAAVEVGAVLRSDDWGATWCLAGGSDGQPTFGQPPVGLVHPDVHSVNIHPTSADLVVAPTGGGFYSSEDGGDTWACLYADCYARAAWYDPTDAEHMILGPAESASGRNGRIEQTRDGGRSWQIMTECGPQNMVERFYHVGDQLFAVMADGELLFTSLTDVDWQLAKLEIAGINDLKTMA